MKRKGTPVKALIVSDYAGHILTFWTEDSRLHTVVDDRKCSYYAYDHAGERTLKLTGDNSVVDVNADFMTSSAALKDYTVYPSPYMVVSNRGYTKHYYAGADRLCARTGGGRLEPCVQKQEFADTAESVFETCLHLSGERILENNDPECIHTKKPEFKDYMHKPLLGAPNRLVAQLSVDAYGIDQVMDYYIHNSDREDDVYFYHGDHLGSASWITDASGIPVQHLQYLPFGEPFVDQHSSIPPPYAERFTFTGKERDAETGYCYFGARYYDSDLSGLFLSVDPMADKHPSISPYAYCAWNPVKLVDPDGREMFPTESAAAKVRANAVDMFGESRVGEIYNKGDEKHPNYAFLVYDYGKDKYERPSSKGVWAYKPDKCVDSKFDLFLYATFKAEKEWSLNGAFSIGGQCGVDVGCVNLGINISSIDLVGIDWDWGKGKVDTYHCEENNARGSRGVSLGLFTLAGQTYEGGDYIDEASKRTNVLGVGVGQSKGQWNITLGVAAILGIQIGISSKIKK